MLKYCLAAVLAVTAVASPVQAQDAEPADKVATGFRVEAIGGIEGTDFDTGNDGQGFLYGLGVGYDFAAGRLRFGVEAEASDSTVSECFRFDLTDICSKSGRDLYVGGRAGGMISSNILLYAKAGYTNMRLTNSSNGPIAGFPPFVAHPKYDGLRLGGGAEVAVRRNMFVKAEYRFSNYEAVESFDKHQGVIGVGIRF
jgi:outer membrane immunogenic protein